MPYVNTIVMAMLVYFLIRFMKQFDNLLIKVDKLTDTLSTHQTEVAVGFQETKGTVAIILERQEIQGRILSDLNHLYDRVRIVEIDVSNVKERMNSRAH